MAAGAVGVATALILAQALGPLEAGPGKEVPSDPGMRLRGKKGSYCHGEDGRAHNVLGLRYGARDFTDTAWQDRTSDAQIRRSILEGVPGTKMRAFRRFYSDGEVELLLGAIRQFRGGRRDAWWP